MLLRRIIIIGAGCSALAVIAMLAAGVPLGNLELRRLWVTSPPARPIQAQGAGAAVRVATARVEVEQVPIGLGAIGTAQAYNTVGVKTRVDGEIVKILFEEGQDVQAGDELAIIDPRPYQAQLRQQEATRQKDQAQLNVALIDLRRYENLVKTTAASQQQLDQQRALVEQLRAQVLNDEAQIDYARTLVDYTTIRSPITGRTGIRLIDQGNIVRAVDNTNIVVITQLQPISVVFTIAAPVVARSRLTLGRTDIPVVAFAADGTTQLDRGKINIVDNQVDQATGTLKLKASFPNAELRLWPGDFTNGRLIVETRDKGLTVPSASVRHGPRGDFVWLVRPNGTVEVRAVVVGQAFAGRTLIERGLAARDQVVTEGHFLLEVDSRVEIVKVEPPLSAAVSRIASDP